MNLYLKKKTNPYIVQTIYTKANSSQGRVLHRRGCEGGIFLCHSPCKIKTKKKKKKTNKKNDKAKNEKEHISRAQGERG